MAPRRSSLIAISLAVHAGVGLLLWSITSSQNLAALEKSPIVSLEMMDVPNVPQQARPEPIPEIKQTELPPETKTEEPLTPRVAQPPLPVISSTETQKPAEVKKPTPVKKPVRPVVDDDDDEEEEEKPKPKTKIVKRVAKRTIERANESRSAPASSAQASAPQIDPNVRANYLRSLSARLASRKFSPSGAPTGTVVVRFSVSRSGGLLARSVARSSGSSVLDGAALSMVARAAPFPPFPAGMMGSSIAITQAINFRGE